MLTADTGRINHAFYFHLLHELTRNKEYIFTHVVRAGMSKLTSHQVSLDAIRYNTLLTM